MISVTDRLKHSLIQSTLIAVIGTMVLLCLTSSGRLFSRAAAATQTVTFHSPLLKHITMYLSMGRDTLTLHVHNGTNQAITQAMIDLIAYWPPSKGERAKQQIDFDNRYRLVTEKAGGIAPYSDGLLTVDWDSDIKAGTKDDPIVPTKVLYQKESVYLYGDELGDPPHVQAWLRDEMVKWKGVSVTLSTTTPHSQQSASTMPWKDLLKPLPEGQRPDHLSYKIGAFDIWNVGSYGIKLKNVGYMSGSTVYHDPIQHYYLQIEEDSPGSPGEYRVLCLSSDAVWKEGQDPTNDVDDSAPVTSRIIRRHLSLVTDTNVRIGDSLYDVARKLGRPSYVDSNTKHAHVVNGLDYNYQGGKLHGWSYDSLYWFDHNRLVGITIVIEQGGAVAD